VHIPPPVACVDLAVYWVTNRIWEAYWGKIEVRMYREMRQNALYTFEYIPVV